jgi:PatG Domain
MEQPESSIESSIDSRDTPTSIQSSESFPRNSLIPQSGGQSCSTCGGTTDSHSPPAYAYALGKIEWRFPNQSVEKEFAQVTGRTDTTGQTDRQAVHAVLSQRQNRYLLRQMCWVLAIEGLATYILQPRDSNDFDLLVEAVRSTPSLMDVDVVIGLRGSIAPPELCNGLMLPIVYFDQIYSFDRNTLIAAIPRPDAIAAEQFTPAAEELFDRIMQLADNAGAMEEHRALNYLTVRYPAIYTMAAEAYGRNCSLTSVDVRPSRLGSNRRIVDVIFSFTNRSTDVCEKFFVRVDVTEMFPFLVTRMSPYYDR